MAALSCTEKNGFVEVSLHGKNNYTEGARYVIDGEGVVGTLKRNRLVSAVVDAAKLIELEVGREYIIQAAGRMEKIPYKDIFYIQRDGGKNSMICSRLGISKVRKSLQQVFDELQAQEFIFIDRGYIVNIIQIMKISDSMAYLKNGETLPISRSHLQEVKKQINRFWGAHI